MKTEKTYDVAVIGAGVFGAWIAYRLQQAGRRVVVLDAYGPGNSRASSGGESRIIRMGYGADEIYTRWSIRSLEMWKSFFDQIHQKLFHPTGVLWMARDGDEYANKTMATLEKLGVPFEKMSRPQLEKRYPQIAFGPVTWGLLETRQRSAHGATVRSGGRRAGRRDGNYLLHGGSRDASRQRPVDRAQDPERK